MFYKANDNNFHTLLKGVSIKTVLVGEKTLFSEIRMMKGSQLPMHAHPQEQTGRLLHGKLVLTVGGEKSEMRPGDCWIVPGNVVHGAEVLEDSVVIEIFAPVREDYLKYYTK